MHLTFTLFWVCEAPTVGAWTITVVSVIAIGLGKVEFPNAPNAVTVITELLIVGRHGSG